MLSTTVHGIAELKEDFSVEAWSTVPGKYVNGSLDCRAIDIRERFHAGKP